MPDLSTKYLGLSLKNPLVASAGPLSKDIGHILHMEDAGISAVVLHSLFEEQIAIESDSLDTYLDSGADSFAESLSYFPDLGNYNVGPDGYVEHLRKAKAAVDVPVIASLNGVSTGGWIRYAKMLEEAGADGLELNLYYMSADPTKDAAAVEQMYTDLVSHLKASIAIPVAVKIGPFFSSIPNIAKKLDDAGADALVMFNRFYQPDIDLDVLDVTPNLVLSNSYELLLRLHWTAIIRDSVDCDIAITGGVHTGEDVIKSMMVGGNVAMMTSAMLRQGIDYVTKLEEDVTKWMEEHEYESIQQMQSSMSAKRVKNPSAYERANYMKVLSSYDIRPSSSVQ
jgi:dihydroorotate dehydrogenase (fumarate)